MEKTISTGITGRKEITVSLGDTAKAWGSGLVEVFATPAMIALMENTAQESVQAFLPEGRITVGTEVHVKHLRATARGKNIVCTSVLKEVDGRRLLFDVQAHDNRGLIGEGTHERFIVDRERFMEKLDQ
ncbi:MAG: thioesterase family protein [Bacteroidales bacterium]|nr:thioesterase family protein [Bacteroidales bacterium]